MKMLRILFFIAPIALFFGLSFLYALTQSVFAKDAVQSQFSTYIGTVISVQDGRTLTLLWFGQPMEIQLADIDAPDAKTSSGEKSKKALESLVLGKTVAAVSEGYISLDHRLVVGPMPKLLAVVFIGEMNVNVEQLRLGYAWLCTGYPGDSFLVGIQDSAAEQNLGIWNQSLVVIHSSDDRHKRRLPARKIDLKRHVKHNKVEQ